MPIGIAMKCFRLTVITVVICRRLWVGRQELRMKNLDFQTDFLSFFWKWFLIGFPELIRICHLVCGAQILRRIVCFMQNFPRRFGSAKLALNGCNSWITCPPNVTPIYNSHLDCKLYDGDHSNSCQHQGQPFMNGRLIHVIRLILSEEAFSKILIQKSWFKSHI